MGNTTDQTRRILIIDDDPGIRLILGKSFEHAGYEVVSCASGEEGLERISESQDVDLVVTDIVMPAVGGFEVIANVKRMCPDVRVGAISGAEPGRAKKYGDLADTVGADLFLAKPFETDVLLANVARLLDG